MNIRLQQLITAEGLNNRRFAEKMGIQSSNVSHIVNGRNKPGYDFIARMLEVFPNINPYWLILGQGNMYRDPAVGDTFPAIDSIKEQEPDTDSWQAEQIKSELNSRYRDNEVINQTKIEFDVPPNDSSQRLQEIDPSIQPSKQNNICINTPEKVSETIDQIVVFYSDGTYKTYIKR